MKQKRIIIVEDDKDLLENMVEYLTLAGYEVTGATSAREFYYHLSRQTYLLAVLDIGLPDQSGLVLAEYVRKNTCMWIIMLTAHSTLDDKLAGLKCGADFYLVKPVDCSELAATIANLSVRLDEIPAFPDENQRLPAQEPWRLLVNKWILLSPEKQVIKLTTKELDFLTLIVSTSKMVTTRPELLDKLGYFHNKSGDHALQSLVNRLRHKIELYTNDSPLHTTHGVGYAFIADIIIE